MGIKTRNIVTFCAFAAVILPAYFFRMHGIPDNTEKPVVMLGSYRVSVDVAETPEQQQQGLSGRTGLANGEGMLFVFQKDSLEGFWMKDMNFPIDIIWADAQGRVVTVWQDLSPKTYPNVFYPTEPSRYVLEIPAGAAAANGIATGTIMHVPDSALPATP